MLSDDRTHGIGDSYADVRRDIVRSIFARHQRKLWLICQSFDHWLRCDEQFLDGNNGDQYVSNLLISALAMHKLN